MFFVDIDFIFNITSIMIGLFLIISGVLQYMHDEQDKAIAATSIITIILGSLCIIFRNRIISMIVGIALIVVPIIKICISDEWKKQIEREIIPIIIGIILLIIGPTNIIEIIVKIIGLACIIISVIYFIYQIIDIKKNNVFDAEYELKE